MEEAAQVQMEASDVERSEMETNASDETTALEEEDTGFQDLDSLLQHGVSGSDIRKLKRAGIKTVKGVEMTMRKKLLEIKGMNEEKVDKIKKACCKISLSGGFVTALEVCHQRKQLFKISTGSPSLDRLLGGGIESMSITEVFGEFGSGKTQLSHTLCVTAQMPGNNGYLGGKVMFIDTEHTFRPHRLRAISDRFNLDENQVLENVLYARAYNSEHQFDILNSVAAKFHEEGGVFKLLIVDSIMALFRVDFCGIGEIADRQQKLGQMMSKLQKISEEYNVAVFITNQVHSDMRGMKGNATMTTTTVISDDAAKPVGGNTLAHASTTRVALFKAEGNTRIANLYDSPELEQSEVVFAITAGGIDDPKD